MLIGARLSSLVSKFRSIYGTRFRRTGWTSNAAEGNPNGTINSSADTYTNDIPIFVGPNLQQLVNGYKVEYLLGVYGAPE